MSGLVVRPGDTLFVPDLPQADASTRAALKTERDLEGLMPGVKVVVCAGFAGGPFVYRPDVDGDR